MSHLKISSMVTQNLEELSARAITGSFYAFFTSTQASLSSRLIGLSTRFTFFHFLYPLNCLFSFTSPHRLLFPCSHQLFSHFPCLRPQIDPKSVCRHDCVSLLFFPFFCKGIGSFFFLIFLYSVPLIIDSSSQSIPEQNCHIHGTNCIETRSAHNSTYRHPVFYLESNGLWGGLLPSLLSHKFWHSSIFLLLAPNNQLIFCTCSLLLQEYTCPMPSLLWGFPLQDQMSETTCSGRGHL